MDLLIYPNPTQDNLNINYLAKNVTNATYTIYNAQGTIVLSNNQTLVTGINKHTIDTKYLAKGMYFITISTPDETINKKFTKN